MKKIFKGYNFFRIFKNYYLILLVFKLNIYFLKLLVYIYSVKKKLLKNFSIKLFFIKKNFMLFIDYLFENYLVIFSLLFFLNSNKAFKTINDLSNIFLILFFDKIKKYDSLLFL